LIFSDYFIESCMGPPCNIRQLDGYPSDRHLSRGCCKGSSETPLHFISRYKGDSVGRYRRSPL